MSDALTTERFLKDVANHEMSILRDDGVNRHISFWRPETSVMRFDLITWPWHLCFTGDMGTYVFQRLEDMFEFFRTDRQHNQEKKLFINPSYWGEKLEAIDRSGGFREWDENNFKEQARSSFKDWLHGLIKDPNFPLEKSVEIEERFEDEVISLVEYKYVGKEVAYEAMQSFEYQGDLPFQDYCEVDTDEYTFRYLWCCYAMAWGIQKYDEARKVNS